MKIAVLGAGNTGCAIAGDMAYRGLDVCLIKTSDSLHNENFSFIKEHNGAINLLDFGSEGCMSPTIENQVRKTGYLSEITSDLSRISQMDVIILCVQTNYHESVIQRISHHLKGGQTLIIIPGYFSTAFVLEYCQGKDLTVIEAQSSFIDCRIMEPGTIKVGFRNVRNPLAVFPKKNTELANVVCDKLGFPYVFLSNVAEAALHNPNMIVHTVGSILSMPMIDTEKERFCMYNSSFTEHVWNVLEALDREKMSVLRQLGCEGVPYVEACKYRNSLDETKNAKDVFFEYAAMPTRAKAPSSVNSRYITEDVPEGLVMLEALANTVGVGTPVCSSLISIASAALSKDFRQSGRTISRLGIDNIRRILDDGVCSIDNGKES